ncbi:MAG: hypothetical protein K0Q72_3186 [Armatimonadetes bacterium]|jgi:hypothetical protein|nr:hypothetical protein [Armatimonadota bacterium]
MSHPETEPALARRTCLRRGISHRARNASPLVVPPPVSAGKTAVVQQAFPALRGIRAAPTEDGDCTRGALPGCLRDSAAIAPLRPSGPYVTALFDNRRPDHCPATPSTPRAPGTRVRPRNSSWKPETPRSGDIYHAPIPAPAALAERAACFPSSSCLPMYPVRRVIFPCQIVSDFVGDTQTIVCSPNAQHGGSRSAHHGRSGYGGSRTRWPADGHEEAQAGSSHVGRGPP